MKRSLITIQFILWAGLIMAQSSAGHDPFYTLWIEKKQTNRDTGSIEGQCDSIVFATGCLSDFTVKDKTYRYRRVVDITADSLMITFPGDHNPVIGISPTDIRSLSTIIECYTRKNEWRWQMAVFDSADYRFSLIRSDQKRTSFTMKICWDEECEPPYTAHLYHHPELGYRYIFKRGEDLYIYGEGDEETVKIESW